MWYIIYINYTKIYDKPTYTGSFPTGPEGKKEEK